MEPLTLGIEEEYQIIDPETRELTSFITEFLEQGAMVFRDQMKPEFLQSQVEVGSNVCQNIKEAKFEIKRLRSMVHEVAQRNNRHFVAAGTHPFSRWEDQRVTNHERYHMLLGNMRILAQFCSSEILQISTRCCNDRCNGPRGDRLRHCG